MCVCCQVEFSATGRSLVQKSVTERGASKCDLGTSVMRRPWSTRAVESSKNNQLIKSHIPKKSIFSDITSMFLTGGTRSFNITQKADIES